MTSRPLVASLSPVIRNPARDLDIGAPEFTGMTRGRGPGGHEVLPDPAATDHYGFIRIPCDARRRAPMSTRERDRGAGHRHEWAEREVTRVGRGHASTVGRGPIGTAWCRGSRMSGSDGPRTSGPEDDVRWTGRERPPRPGGILRQLGRGF